MPPDLIVLTASNGENLKLAERFVHAAAARNATAELIDLTRRDECCGFGGVFSVEEEAVSTRMGLDRLEDHRRGRAEVLTSTDVSCLLHLEGLARRQDSPLRILHIAEILAEATLGPGWLERNADRSGDGPR